MVAGDAFRCPPRSAALAVRAGAGVQILGAGAATLVAAALGFLSPAARGALLSALLGAYLLMSAAAGYVAVRLWGAMRGSHDGWPAVAWRAGEKMGGGWEEGRGWGGAGGLVLWGGVLRGWRGRRVGGSTPPTPSLTRHPTPPLLPGALYPGVSLAALGALNLLLARTGSTGALPLRAFASLVALWLAVGTPLTLAGGAAAARASPPSPPTRTNQIPRHVPPPPWAAHPRVLHAAAGLLPFGCLLVELYFIMTSVWQGYFYYVFGFCLAVGALAAATVALVSVVCTYAQLCAEDYRWWWASYARGGAVAHYVALYCAAFLVSALRLMDGAVGCEGWARPGGGAGGLEERGGPAAGSQGPCIHLLRPQRDIHLPRPQRDYPTPHSSTRPFFCQAGSLCDVLRPRAVGPAPGGGRCWAGGVPGLHAGYLCRRQGGLRTVGEG